MLKKFLAAVGMTMAVSSPVQAAGLHSPYQEAHVNFLYNLLFCDDLILFRKHGAGKESGAWEQLFAERPDRSALFKIANDEKNEGRVRALAYNRLRMAGATVPPKRILGVIVEVPLANGLDVLAAFSDGGARYLNQSGKVAVFDVDTGPIARMAKELLLASQPVVDQIGPWDKPRLPPPKAGDVRITFLVSDGLYFGEGPFAVLQKDDMAGPILAKATELLQHAVKAGSK